MSNTNTTPLYKQHLPAFLEALEAKLQQGHETYGDHSFSGPISETLAELEQECLDHCGWGFILWVKLQRLRAALPKD